MEVDPEHFRKLERLYHGAPINRFYGPTLTVSHGAAELIYLVGLYCLVSVTLNGFDVPVPE